MHRIDGANATVDNKFTLGNPGAGIPATTVTADIMNALQEELCSVIEAAGITLDKNNNGQLLAALRNLAFSTGDGKLTLKSVADYGWVMANDGTLGSASSGATTRAHADTQPLYTILWGFAPADAPIYDSTGAASTRGVSAAADFAANKRLSLTKNVGRALCIAGAGAGLTARTLGSVYGQETVALTAANNGPHTHGVNDGGHGHGVNDPGHPHDVSHGQSPGQGANFGGAIGADDAASGYENVAGAALTNTTGISINGATTGITIQSQGSGTAHENMQPSAFWNAMIKL